MLHILLNWLLGALALWIVAQIIPEIEVRGYGTALLAMIVIVLVDATVGRVLRFLTIPLTFLTLGLFRLVVNAVLLKLASLFTPGFSIRGFLPAVVGSLVLTVLSWALRVAVPLMSQQRLGFF